MDVESTTGQVKQAQSVVPPMERLVQGLEKQQADTLKYVFVFLSFFTYTRDLYFFGLSLYCLFSLFSLLWRSSSRLTPSGKFLFLELFHLY